MQLWPRANVRLVEFWSSYLCFMLQDVLAIEVIVMISHHSPSNNFSVFISVEQDNNLFLVHIQLIPSAFVHINIVTQLEQIHDKFQYGNHLSRTGQNLFSLGCILTHRQNFWQECDYSA